MVVDDDATVRSPFKHVCAQHVEEIAQLWSIWQTAVGLPHYDRFALAELENRVQAHIAGARVYGDDAWRQCEAGLDIADAGEIFAAAQIAFRSYDAERVKKVVDVVEQNQHMAAGLVSALAWLPGDISHPWLKKFLDSKHLPHKTMALAACRLRGEDPAAYLARLLQRDDCMADSNFADIALRCTGEFKRFDLQALIQRQLGQSEEPAYAVLYAAILLGDESLVARLKPFVFAGPLQGEAIDLAFRVLSGDMARQWIREMLEKQLDNRWTIRAAQTLGDPQAVPWLVGLMREPLWARLAGHAFYTITGVDLTDNELTLVEPRSLEQRIARELADESSEMPIDEHLPWPDVDKIWHVWNSQLVGRYIQGQRYLLGLPITEANLKTTFANGFQPQRHAAALELALLNKNTPLLNAFACAAPER